MVTIKKISHLVVDFQVFIQVFEKVLEIENFHIPAKERIGLLPLHLNAIKLRKKWPQEIK